MSEGDGGVNDLAGIGEVLNSEVANKVYDDGLSGATKSAGEGLTDVVDGLRLFTLPFRMMATVRERIERWLARVRADVRPEQQVDAAPEIAGPVLEKLRFQTDESPLTELYLNLLRRAIDRERRNEAHPAFANIIAQLSADEALFLSLLRQELLSFVDKRMNREIGLQGIRYPNSQFVDNLEMYIEHLRGLNLLAPLEFKLRSKPSSIGSDFDGEIGGGFGGGVVKIDVTQKNDVVKLSAFGLQFCKAVLPDKFPETKAEESSGDEKSA